MRSSLRIVLLDLETLPNAREAVRVWPQLSNYPGLTLKATINSIICAGWKVHGQKHVHCINAWDYPEWKRDVNADRGLVTDLYQVLVGADVVVTWNGDGFDLPFLRTRLLKYRLSPLPKLVHIDGKKVVKKHFYLFNNRMQTAAKFLETREKIDNGGWELWDRVYDREPKAMREMTTYCKGDIETLDQIFTELLPYVKLPNANQFVQEMSCPNCSSTDLQRRGERITIEKRFQRYQCKACGTWSSGKEGKVLKVDL